MVRDAAASDNALLQGAGLAAQGRHGHAQLRQQARAPLDTILEETRAKVEGALNRDRTSGVQLSGTVRTGKLLDVLVHPRWLVVRAEADWTLALDVDRAITVRRTVNVGR